jgi:hypothetical protein
MRIPPDNPNKRWMMNLFKDELGGEYHTLNRFKEERDQYFDACSHEDCSKKDINHCIKCLYFDECLEYQTWNIEPKVRLDAYLKYIQMIKSSMKDCDDEIKEWRDFKQWYKDMIIRPEFVHDLKLYKTICLYKEPETKAECLNREYLKLQKKVDKAYKELKMISLEEYQKLTDNLHTIRIHIEARKELEEKIEKLENACKESEKEKTKNIAAINMALMPIRGFLS